MKMKKVLALLLALVMVVTAFAACGEKAPAEETKPEEESAATSEETAEDATAESGNAEGVVTLSEDPAALFEPYSADAAKSIVVNGGMEPTTLNTLNSTYSIEFTTLRHLYHTLTVADKNDAVAPGAAESWDYDEASLTYTFHLRKDGTWTNGDSVTANDFAFAWSQVLNPEVAADYAYFLFVIKNAEAYYNQECTWEEVGIKVIDDWTLEVTLENPTPYFLSQLSFGTFCPVNQRFYEAVGADLYNTEAEYFCTNGAYALTEWVHKDKWVIQKRPDFCGDATGTADDIQVEQITFRIIEDGNAALNSFLGGELDFVGLLNGEMIAMAEAQGYAVTNYNDGAAFYLAVNHENEYLSNANLRRALAYAMNKEEMINTVFKNANVGMTAFTTPGVSGVNGLFADVVGELIPATGDQEKAKEYFALALEELGITVEELNGKLSIDASQDTTILAMCAYYQEQWKQVLGLEVAVNPMDTKQNSANRGDGNYVMSHTGWGPDYNDPNTFLDLWVSDGGNNDTKFASDRYDELIAMAAVESDLAKREEYFIECEQIIADQLPVIPNYWRGSAYTMSSKIVPGTEVYTMNQTNYRWVEFA